VPDAISRLLKYREISSSPEDKESKINRRRALREQETFDMIFGQGRHAYIEPPAPSIEPDPEPEPTRDEVTGLPLGDFYGSMTF
jgi:hypothetical protein